MPAAQSHPTIPANQANHSTHRPTPHWIRQPSQKALWTSHRPDLQKTPILILCPLEGPCRPDEDSPPTLKSQRWPTRHRLRCQNPRTSDPPSYSEWTTNHIRRLLASQRPNLQKTRLCILCPARRESRPERAMCFPPPTIKVAKLRAREQTPPVPESSKADYEMRRRPDRPLARHRSLTLYSSAESASCS
jgi:hypothetical protein